MPFRRLRSRHRYSALLGVLVLGCAVVAVPTAPEAAAVSGITTYSDSSVSLPQFMTAGPDGALWFTNFGNNSIGRITASGTVSNFTNAIMVSPAGITVGPDGALWFANFGGEHVGDGVGSIARITTAGTVTNFTDATIANPESIAAGSDGALWFDDWGHVNSIGRITTSGTVSHFTDPTISSPRSVTAGPDGALWFTNSGTNSIGRITTSGTVSNFVDPGIVSPRDITAGPDGALWFINGSHSIGRITTSGNVTDFADASISDSNLRAITAGPDGALWFTATGPASGWLDTIGRVTTSGAFTAFPLDPNVSTGPALTSGPDGAIWFGSDFGTSISRLATPAPTATGCDGLNDPSLDSAYVGGTYGSDFDAGEQVVMQETRLSAGSSEALLSVDGKAVDTKSAPGPVTTLTYTFPTTGRHEVLWGNPPVAAQWSVSCGVPAHTAPAAPIHVTAVPRATTSRKSGPIAVTFAAGANVGSPITAFTATCSSRNGGATRSAHHSGSRAAPIIVGGATLRKAYTCRVAATNATGTGPASAPSELLTVGAPAKVAAASISKIGRGKIKVSFPNLSGSQTNGSALTTPKYTAACKSSNGGPTKAATGTKSPIGVAGLSTGKRYTCTVKAHNARGYGQTSNASRASTA